MSAPNTTPGPWLIESGANSYFFEVRIVAGEKCVAFAEGEEARDEEGDVVLTPSPDAHLIAAAPCMYEALEAAIGALEFSRDYHSDLGNAEQAFAQDKLDAALKALRKARGDQS